MASIEQGLASLGLTATAATASLHVSVVQLVARGTSVVTQLQAAAGPSAPSGHGETSLAVFVVLPSPPS